MKIKVWLAIALCIPMLSGCIKGILPDPEAEAKKVEDEAAATGAACRQAGRSLEVCYQRNDGLNRNGALRGWRDMDEYMRSNKLEPQPPSAIQEEKEAALKDASKDAKDMNEAKEPAPSTPPAEPSPAKP